MPGPDNSPVILQGGHADVLRAALKDHIQMFAEGLAGHLESGQIRDAQDFAHRVVSAVAALDAIGWEPPTPAERFPEGVQ